jgi:hypothetical protein
MFINYGTLFSGFSTNVEHKGEKPIVQHIKNMNVLTEKHEIMLLGFGDPEEIDVLIGMSCPRLKIYDTDCQTFTSGVELSCWHGSIGAISRYKN